jgi:hypothetical protein
VRRTRVWGYTAERRGRPVPRPKLKAALTLTLRQSGGPILAASIAFEE